MLTELLAEAFRIARYGDPDAAWAFAANAARRPAGAVLGTDASRPATSFFFWANILLVCFFLAYLPRSKHLHIATAFFNTAFRKLAPRGELPAMDLEAETAPFRRQDHRGPVLEGPARRLHVHRVRPLPGCLPGVGDGQAAQPQDDDHGPARDVGRGGGGRAAHPLHPAGATAADRDRAALERPIVDAAIPYDAVWDCVTCGACVEACPVLIEHVDKIVGLRRNLVLEEARFPAELTSAFTAMERHGNPWGQPASAASRLDAGPAVRGPDRGRGRGRRGRTRSPPSSASTGSAARPPSTTATGASRGRS